MSGTFYSSLRVVFGGANIEKRGHQAPAMQASSVSGVLLLGHARVRACALDDPAELASERRVCCDQTLIESAQRMHARIDT